MPMRIAHHKVGANKWKLGEGLWWRDEYGIHGVVLTKAPTKRRLGRLTSLVAPTLRALNDALRTLGFGPLALRKYEIAWKGVGTA